MLGEILREEKQRIGTVDADNLPLLGVSNDEGLHRSEMTRIKDMSRYLRVERGWFAYNPMRINVGSVGWAKGENQTGVISPDYVVFSCTELICPELIYWFLKHRRGLRAINAETAGSVRERLYFNSLARIRFSLPPIAEQIRLVERVDEFIAKIGEAQAATADIELWNQQLLLAAFHRVTEGVSRRRLGEIAPLTRRPATIDPFSDYPQVSVRSFGRGTFHNPPLAGSEITWEKPHLVKAGDILISNIKAWEGAIAVAGQEDDGRYGSHRYLTYVPIAGLATARFVCFYLLTPEGLHYVGEASPGSADRNRTTSAKALLEIPVPLPTHEQQLWFCELYEKVEAIKRLQTEAASARQSLVPAILDRAFKGELFISIPVPESHQVRTKHSRGIAFKRAAVAAYVIDKLRGDPTLGRVKMEKALHLIESHCGIDLEREPVRDAAGPNDYPALRKVESLATKKGWFTTQARSGGKGATYIPGDHIQDRIEAAIRIFGPSESKVTELVKLLRRLNTRQSEIVATLYASWNDFLLANKTPTDEEIVHDVRENWHESKKQIPADKWHRALKWMREKGLVPKGSGRLIKRRDEP
jgi:type I restriction enzyme S subunit